MAKKMFFLDNINYFRRDVFLANINVPNILCKHIGLEVSGENIFYEAGIIILC